MITDKELYLSDFKKHFAKKTSASQSYAEKYRAHLCSNRRPFYPFRKELKEIRYPIVVQSSEGSHVKDLDGHTLVDLCCGFGTVFFGHREPFLIEALERQMKRGIQIGPESDRVGELSERISQSSGLSRVLYQNSGTEAVMTAMRIARAYRNKPGIVIFSDNFHGHFDGTLAIVNPDSPPAATPKFIGVPQGMVNDIVVLPFGEIEQLAHLLRQRKDIAAVLIEPVQNAAPHRIFPGFIKKVRELTSAHDVSLIFDEVLIGFRIALGGGQEYFGVKADMVAYGKVISGGMPLSVVCGDEAHMAMVDGGIWSHFDHSAPQANLTFNAGTFCRHPLSVAHALAVIEKLQEEPGKLQQKLNARCDQMIHELNEHFEKITAPIRAANIGSFFRFLPDPARRMEIGSELFFYHMVYHGIYIWEGHSCFLTLAHSDEDIAKIVHAAKKSSSVLKEVGWW